MCFVFFLDQAKVSEEAQALDSEEKAYPISEPDGKENCILISTGTLGVPANSKEEELAKDKENFIKDSTWL